MKKLVSWLLLCASLNTGYAQIEIGRVDPPCWWTGMENRELQIMLYGKNIADCDAQIERPGVSLTKAVALDSKNYLFLHGHTQVDYY